MTKLSCSHGQESVKALQFSGKGRHEIRITRNTAMTEHVQGKVSLTNAASRKLFNYEYRSDKGGFRHIVDISDDDRYELQVTGSAHSFASGIFGCADSGVQVTVSPEAIGPSGSGQWVVGLHIRDRVKWEAFATRAEAQKCYDDAWWSKVLFSPLGVVVNTCAGTLDTNGYGVAVLHRSYGTRNAAMGKQLSFSLNETSTDLAADCAGDVHKARIRSEADLADYFRFFESPSGSQPEPYEALKSEGGYQEPLAPPAPGAPLPTASKEYLIDFAAENLGQLVELLEQNFEAAGIKSVQSARMLITDEAGGVVDDWPETEERFPLRVRYTREVSVPVAQDDVHLLEHGQLAQDLYAAQGMDLVSLQAKARNLLHSTGLRTQDMGARNVDERGRYINNQCFYLSLARGLLGHTASRMQHQGLALKLKRSIEASVIAERPHWQREVGEEAQAFADFLPIAMHGSKGSNFLGELAVCIIDSSSGHVEAYLGPLYKQISDPLVQQRNLVILWYIPGHYKCVVNGDREGSKVMLSYNDFRDLLLTQDVQFIETLE